jgi:hypothetical protein
MRCDALDASDASDARDASDACDSYIVLRTDKKVLF